MKGKVKQYGQDENRKKERMKRKEVSWWINIFKGRKIIVEIQKQE